MQTVSEMRDAYERDGYVVVDDLVPLDLIDEALHGVERLHSGERDSALPSASGFLDWRLGDPFGTRINDYVSLQNEQVRTLVEHKPIASVAALLAETSCIRLFHDQVISKDAGFVSHTTVGLHTDIAYWHTCSSRKMLTAWVPLTPCPPARGALTVVPGSHRWSENDDLAGFWNDESGDALATVEAPSGATREIVTLDLEPGQVSFHHCRTVHGSGPNCTDSPRCAVAIHLQDEDNEYVSPGDVGPRNVHVNDLLSQRRPDGSPDYSDPFVSPVLFAGSQAEALGYLTDRGNSAR